MNIKKVITDEHYKKKYIFIKNAIYELESSKKNKLAPVSEINKAILKNNDKKLKPSHDLIKVKYRPFPSNNKMIEILEKEKVKIYSRLNLNSIVGKNAPIIKAILLYEYLCKNSMYDMTAQEDSANVMEIQKGFSKIDEKMDVLRKKYSLKYCKLESALSKENKKEINKSLNKILHKLRTTEKESEDYSYNVINSIYLKSVYNTIMFNKGVCSNFSYAYQFLLEGCGLNAYIIETLNEEDSIGHAFNIIETIKDEDAPKYYIVDLTYGNSKKDQNVVKIINSFAINKQDYFKLIDVKEVDKIKVLNFKDPNSKSVAKEIELEPNFSIMCEKMEDRKCLTEAKQQAIEHILKYDIMKLAENGLER